MEELPNPRVLITSALRNEAPYVIDWLAHYLAAGATDFLLYTNDCADGTDTLLETLASHGVVTHVAHAPAPDTSIQWQAFRAAWKHDLRKRTDWAMVCDVDEFINIRTPGHHFASLINALPKHTDAVALPWRLFGASRSSISLDVPVPERCTQAMSPDLSYPLAATLFKTLFRVDGPFNQFGIHRPSQKSAEKATPAYWVDGAGNPLPSRFSTDNSRLSLLGLKPGRSLADIHHYSLRSAEEFIIKTDRGLPNRRDKEIGLQYWVERNFRTIQDNSLAPMTAAAQKWRVKLMGLPGVAALYDQGLDWHRTTFSRLVQDEEIFRLYSRALLAGNSEEMPNEQARRLYQMFGATKGGPA